MPNNNFLGQLVEISNLLGKDPELVLAGGGNTSYKNESELYIKASGTSLSDITDDGFVVMDRSSLKKIWGENYPSDDDLREKAVLKDIMSARRHDQSTKRPSVEVLLHDMFPQRFVVHTHPTIINAITCSLEGKQAMVRLFGEHALWIDETKPGFLLASTVKTSVNEYNSRMRKPLNILFMQNHGLLVAADTIEEINSLHDTILNTVKQNICIATDFSPIEYDKNKAAMLAPAIRMIIAGEGTAIVTFRNNCDINDLVQDEVSFNLINSPFTPDHIVYCRHKFLFIKAKPDIEKQYKEIISGIDSYKNEYKGLPKIIAVEKLGVFVCGKSRKEVLNALDLFEDAVKVFIYSKSFGGPKYMSSDLVSFIVNWESESYRQKIALNDRNGKRTDEKIAVITGSAQGFGKGIAEELAKEGANVVLADININQAKSNAKELCHNHGRGKSMALKCDVGSEADIQSMFVDTVLEFGGLDIFISNAGILRAGGLEEIDSETFELMTKINYTAYFLGVKYASQYMKIQNKFNNSYYTDIIQINSKSGISGSNKNFTYAGGKFGGIGLTQSFALELASTRIKVNSICPGNFFDGPLWSDPDKGLFVQYLKAGKIPGAKTFEDVKNYYEGMVPLKRGCEIKDVARAVFYCIEQLYETGQAIPVTGGQIMLK